MSEALFCEEHAVGVIPPGCPLCRVAELEAALSEKNPPVDCPDCAVTETATGWTLRRCNRHRIEVRFASVPDAAIASPADGEGEKRG